MHCPCSSQLPQASQISAPSTVSALHPGHVASTARELPQSAQNLAESALLWPQQEQARSLGLWDAASSCWPCRTAPTGLYLDSLRSSVMALFVVQATEAYALALSTTVIRMSTPDTEGGFASADFAASVSSAKCVTPM